MISRRRFLADTALAAAAFHSPLLFAQPTSAAAVHTPSGPLRGEQLAGCRVFRGIPFAQPPTGALRFRPPTAMLPWSTERDATRFAPAAMQPGLASSEDCLYLNLWAPDGPGPFPVYVWIHGGGFTSGNSFAPIFDGAQLAREGVLTVTVAYRLGVFGFLDVSPLLGPSFADSANNGVRDLVAALGWVRDHIASFHGDPARATIGGESAGAKLACTLMGVPSATSLFHQVISESGGAERIASPQQNSAVAGAFADRWRAIAPSASVATAPPATLLEVQEAFTRRWPGRYPLRPAVDGLLLPHLPLQSIAQGSTSGKRLLLGTNRDESALFSGPNPQPALPGDLSSLSVDRFAPLAARYAELYPTLTEPQRRIRALTAEEYWVPSLRVADAHLAGGGSAWVYRLDFTEASGRLKGFAYHSLDLPLVWDHPSPTIENAAAEAALAHRMHQAWVTFLRGEDPSAAGLPPWLPYRTDTRPTMIFDTASHLDQNPHQKELQLWAASL